MPEIVKAALCGPAAAEIQHHKLILQPFLHPNRAQLVLTISNGMPASASAQTPGIRPQSVPSVGMASSYFPSQRIQFMRSALPIPPVSDPWPPQALLLWQSLDHLR
ncbi:unnamed protein product [Linum trigynum]|uniref:Uncharacterized protein n=1 Tax=Linum trigynum TaxID=586398 RepID=A0AAV2ECI0_9ROSI